MKHLALTLILVLFSSAFAQEGLLGTILNVDTWVQEMSGYADTYSGAFETIAYALATLGFVTSLIGVLARGSLGAMNDVFFRLFMVAALFALAPSITTLSLDTWDGLRGWSVGEMERTYREGAAELEQLGRDAGVLAFGMTGVASGALRLSGAAAAQAAAQGAGMTAINLLNAAVIPIALIALIAHFIILGAGIAIIIACAFLPISAGMLAFSPTQGGEWLGRIVGAIVSALVVTAFMPLVFKAGFELMVVQPIASVNAEFAEFSDFFNPTVFQEPPRLAEIESERQAVMTQMEANVDTENLFARGGGVLRNQGLDIQLATLGAEAIKVRGQWTLSMLRERTNAFEAIANEVKRWFMRLCILLMAAFMASGLTWFGASAATKLVGGVIGAKVGALAAGGLSGLFRGGGRMSGAGGGGAGNGAPAPAAGTSGSSYSTTAAKPSFNSGGGPSGGGGRTYSPSQDASTTASGSAGTATATVQKQGGSTTHTRSVRTGAISSTASRS